MTPRILEQCTAGAFDGSVPFPETIRRLAEDGVFSMGIAGAGVYGPFKEKNVNCIRHHKWDGGD